jgi:hypothetical protein
LIYYAAIIAAGFRLSLVVCLFLNFVGGKNGEKAETLVVLRIAV